MNRLISLLGRVWFTGLLIILASLGYVLYGALLTLRFMQTRIILATFAALAAALLVGAGGVYYLNSPGPRGAEPIEIIVAPGTSLGGVSRQLRRAQVVPSARALSLWLKITRIDRRIQAGRFFFVKNDGVFRAARKLTHAQPLETRVTVPEGLTLEQTARIFFQVLGIDTAEFIRLCHDSDLTRRVNAPGGSLEGYLCPDTYLFGDKTTARQAIDRMLAHFQAAVAHLSTDSLTLYGMSRHQIVTMASIVEKEATIAEERPRIAGVFYNRIRLGYPLGADPTVRYIFKKFSGPLRVSELTADSPYNTRRFPGLPPGPICSPGVASLQAAMNPMKTKDLYFVAKWDGSGAHDFSATNAEHERKKMQIRAMNDRRLREHGSGG